jgi:fructokinase
MEAGLLGGIETGGTKIVCAVGPSPTNITARIKFPTGKQPADSMRQAAAFFAEQTEEQNLDLLGIGIGSFGPCDPDPGSPTYGYVTSTPKPGWANTDVIDGLRRALNQAHSPADMPIAFDTDVNAAAFGEAHHGAGRGLSNLVYLTVGTGIGGGVVVGNQLLHGLVHPEIGHIRIPRPAAEVATFDGVCPYHGDCWEGVAAGPAIAARWGRPAQDLPPDHEAWDLEAYYLAMGLHVLVCVLSPERIILGGGVGSHERVLKKVRPLLQESLAGYVDSPAILTHINSYLVEPDLGDDAGVTGALALAASHI